MMIDSTLNVTVVKKHEYVFLTLESTYKCKQDS